MPHLQWPGDLTSDLIFAIGNIFFTMRAVVFNYHEWKYGFRELRWVSGWRMIFAFAYCLSYLLLTFSSVDRLFWSHIMLGLSWPVWEMVWVRPAKTTRKLREALVSQGTTNLNERRNKRVA